VANSMNAFLERFDNIIIVLAIFIIHTMYLVSMYVVIVLAASGSCDWIGWKLIKCHPSAKGQQILMFLQTIVRTFDKYRQPFSVSRLCKYKVFTHESTSILVCDCSRAGVLCWLQ
jgi:hypothetical protein